MKHNYATATALALLLSAGSQVFAAAEAGSNDQTNSPAYGPMGQPGQMMGRVWVDRHDGSARHDDGTRHGPTRHDGSRLWTWSDVQRHPRTTSATLGADARARLRPGCHGNLTPNNDSSIGSRCVNRAMGRVPQGT